MSQSIKMAVWIEITVLQSIEIAFRTDYNCVTVDRDGS